MLLAAEAIGGLISGNKRNVSKRSIVMILFLICAPLTIKYYDTRQSLKLSQSSKKICYYIKTQEYRERTSKQT